jgi:hypothetical protein
MALTSAIETRPLRSTARVPSAATIEGGSIGFPRRQPVAWRHPFIGAVEDPLSGTTSAWRAASEPERWSDPATKLELVCATAESSESSAAGTPADRSEPDLRDKLRRALERARESAERIEEDEGEKPSPRAFRDAEAFIDLLPPRIAEPSVWASGDAEVGFTWKVSGNFLEIAFRGDGRLRWAAGFPSEHSETWRGDVVEIDLERATRLPETLMSLLDRLVGADG